MRRETVNSSSVRGTSQIGKMHLSSRRRVFHRVHRLEYGFVRIPKPRRGTSNLDSSLRPEGDTISKIAVRFIEPLVLDRLRCMQGRRGEQWIQRSQRERAQHGTHSRHVAFRKEKSRFAPRSTHVRMTSYRDGQDSCRHKSR